MRNFTIPKWKHWSGCLSIIYIITCLYFLNFEQRARKLYIEYRSQERQHICNEGQSTTLNNYLFDSYNSKYSVLYNTACTLSCIWTMPYQGAKIFTS
jgi:hypothetical protein